MTTWHTVHVRINDAATGRPTPVRLSFEQQGCFFAPFGRVLEFATAPGTYVGGHLQQGGQKWFYIDGTCEVALPAGELTVHVVKGPEYRELHQTVSLGPGQISLRLTVERLADLRPEGWYAGDTHALFLSPHAALLEGAAEDLAVVNLLACQWRRDEQTPWALPNMLAFSGTAPALQQPGHLVVVNTLNTHPVLGTLALLNSHRAVFPLRFGDGEAGDNWTLADWCEQCHRKKGLVVWSDPGSMNCPPPEFRLEQEALANAILGQINAFEITASEGPTTPALQAWYLLLAAGIHLPLVGGSGKNSNIIALGRMRTYAHLPPEEPLSYSAWIEAVRAGRTVVTNGPLLTLQVAGKQPGKGVDVSPDQPLQVVALAQGRGAERLEILFNGTVIATQSPGNMGETLRLQQECRFSESGWLAARCWGEQPLPDGQIPLAHTSPVYLRVQGEGLHPDAATVATLLGALEPVRRWVVEQACCPGEKERQDLLGILDAARHELQRRQRS